MACLSAQDLGITGAIRLGSGDIPDIGAAAMDTDGRDGATDMATFAAVMLVADMDIATVTLAAGSMAEVDIMEAAVADFTVAEASMVAVDSTEEAGSTVADTGNPRR